MRITYDTIFSNLKDIAGKKVGVGMERVDIHALIASEIIYGVPIDKVTQKMRQHAKMINFSALYGAQ